MAGHITKRGKRSDGSDILRVRYPDPSKDGAAQIEKRLTTKREAGHLSPSVDVAIADGLGRLSEEARPGTVTSLGRSAGDSVSDRLSRAESSGGAS